MQHRDSYGMTDADFEAFMQRLERLADLDAKGATRIGRLYTSITPRSEASIAHSRDIASAQLNNELYGDNDHGR